LFSLPRAWIRKSFHVRPFCDSFEPPLLFSFVQFIFGWC
jgi:hypothetical protein